MTKRRGRGQGTITQRKDGTWMAAVHIGYEGGKRKRKYYYGKTQPEVAKKLRAGLRDLDDGINLLPEKQTVGQFLEFWLRESVKPTVRASTHENYANLTRAHLITGLGDTQLQKLTPQHVQSFLNTKLAEGLSTRTVQYLHVLLKRSLNLAHKWDLVPRNVALLVDSPRVVRKDVVPFTPEETKKLLAAVKGDRLEALYLVALSVGLRRGELLALRWQDIDFKKGTLRVAQSLARTNGELVFDEPKTKRGKRTIKLPGSVLAALQAHRERQQWERKKAGTAWHELDLVFPSVLGTPTDPRTLARIYEATLQRAGVPKLNIHAMRHTAASIMLHQGVPIETISEILGHAGVAITMGVYAHLYDRTRENAADAMERFLIS